jgi:hypothetical protein
VILRDGSQEATQCIKVQSQVKVSNTYAALEHLGISVDSSRTGAVLQRASKLQSEEVHRMS